MAIRSGKLRQRITLQAKSGAQDTFGQPAETWTDVATVWASVEPLQGREFMAAQQLQAEVTTRFRLRYREGVTPDLRVLYDGRVFNIQAVIDPDERHAELHLMAVEVVG